MNNQTLAFKILIKNESIINLLSVFAVGAAFNAVT